MIRWREIWELTRIRLLLMSREPEAIFWVFLFPVILGAVLGFAFSRQEPSSSRIGILPGEGRVELIELLESVDGLETVRCDEEEAAEKMLFRGAVDALVRPQGVPEIRYDPGRSEGVTARLRVLEVWRESLSTEPLPTMHEATESDTGSRYIDFLFPGLLGMNLMSTGVWGIGFAIVDIRRKKLLKRIVVTPMRRSSFLLSFILSRMVFMVTEVLVLLSFGRFFLGVPFDGSVILFCSFCLMGTLCFAGLGLLAASRVQTLEGASGVMNFMMMPMWLGSGVFFSYERFPEVVQPLIQILPLTCLADALREIMLDDAGLGSLLFEFSSLALWAVVTFIFAVKVFRWK